ncbi:uncharacterized protein LOC128680069 isoform X2 [Plodia interpunctella]|uniref:uncharacterized protein LOC128680069 isoform X2 n=1 Tax=Plodia interpunctella TaxID=58824 RepID=UPI002368C7FB|nr:uncharacterized protein LOC128680069 isoform X2 [Plodia interpunctella]
MFMFLIIMFVPYLSAHMIDVRDFEDDDDLMSGLSEKDKIEALQIRCTRRFSPGTCMDDVKPVWTYNFHLQNCTERLGCRQHGVTNRFLSYRRCMISCQSLIQIYNHILSQSELDVPLTRKQSSLFRSREEQETKNMPTEESSEDEYDLDNSYDPYLENQAGREDPERIALAEILPPDLDRHVPEFSLFDPLHRPRFQ